MIQRIERVLLVCALIIIVYFLVFYQFEQYFQPHDPVLVELRSQLSVLHPRFRNIHIYEGDKSYTINKKRVHICLKDEHGRYYNRNMLVYVILHEYAHILCDEVGHTNKFSRIFDDLLDKASDANLYNPSIPPLEKYCGVE